LIWFREHVNSQSYVQALEDNSILGLLNQIFGENGYIFQQDGARPHTACSTMQYLRSKAQLLPNSCSWPPSSPDLSPIENVWGILKKTLDVSAIRDAEGLFQEVNRIWDAIDLSVIDNLMRSIKPRIFTLEDVHGASLTGHKDMIHCYEARGLGARDQAIALRESHQIPGEFLTEMRHSLSLHCFLNWPRPPVTLKPRGRDVHSSSEPRCSMRYFRSSSNDPTGVWIEFRKAQGFLKGKSLKAWQLSFRS
jgi:hypothetical protein